MVAPSDDTWTIVTPPHIFADIVEVRDVGTVKANFYLANGYRLLSIQPYSSADRLHDGHGFIRKYAKFIVGRPAGIEAVTPPERAVLESEGSA